MRSRAFFLSTLKEAPAEAESGAEESADETEADEPAAPAAATKPSEKPAEPAAEDGALRNKRPTGKASHRLRRRNRLGKNLCKQVLTVSFRRSGRRRLRFGVSNFCCYVENRIHHCR